MQCNSGESLPRYMSISSDTLQTQRPYTSPQAADLTWQLVASQHPEAKGFYMVYPDSTNRQAVIIVTIYPSVGKIYDNQGYIFDRFTLKELPKDKIYGMKFSEASFGNQIRRLNHDIHIGYVLGFPGKVLAFFASLIGASLPITEFIIWWGKKKKTIGKQKKMASAH